MHLIVYFGVGNTSRLALPCLLCTSSPSLWFGFRFLCTSFVTWGEIDLERGGRCLLFAELIKILLSCALRASNGRGGGEREHSGPEEKGNVGAGIGALRLSFCIFRLISAGVGEQHGADGRSTGSSIGRDIISTFKDHQMSLDSLQAIALGNHKRRAAAYIGGLRNTANSYLNIQ